MLKELAAQIAEDGKWLFFTDCGHLYQFRRQLHSLQSSEALQQPACLNFDDTDHAIEWCENETIAAAGFASSVIGDVSDLSQQYLCQGMTAEELDGLREAGRECRFGEGEVIVSSGATGATTPTFHARSNRAPR